MDGSGLIKPGSGSAKKTRIHSDLDPKHWLKAYFFMGAGAGEKNQEPVKYGQNPQYCRLGTYGAQHFCTSERCPQGGQPRRCWPLSASSFSPPPPSSPVHSILLRDQTTSTLVRNQCCDQGYGRIHIIDQYLRSESAKL